jgi:hypothetical protein
LDERYLSLTSFPPVVFFSSKSVYQDRPTGAAQTAPIGNIDRFDPEAKENTPAAKRHKPGDAAPKKLYPF